MFVFLFLHFMSTSIQNLFRTYAKYWGIPSVQAYTLLIDISSGGGGGGGGGGRNV